MNHGEGVSALRYRSCKWVAFLTVSTFLAGCSNEPEPASSTAPVNSPGPKVTRIEPGPDAAKQAQEALILAKPGEILEFGAGTFEFRSTLSLDVSGVTIRGQGPDKTILSFREQGQGTGGEGILATGKNGFTLQSLALVDAKGDAIKVNGTDKVVVRDVKVSWSGGSKETNGGYGVYPVTCSNVLIEDCHVSGASDAGIYVGQSRNIIVRRNTAEGNVAGIEVENSVDADVTENLATGNAGGILVFTLPDLPKKIGKNCRVFKNRIVTNNHANFAPKGNIVATVPPGTGLMIMANDQVEVFDNAIEDNNSTGISVISYLLTAKPVADAAYDPFCEGISIHGNRFARNGTKPGGDLLTLVASYVGSPLPDIIFDGIVNPKTAAEASAASPPVLAIRDNGPATFANFDAPALSPEAMQAGKKPTPILDLKAYSGEIAALPAIVIEGEK